MENQNEPLLIRPSRTPKTNPKKNFCSKSLPTMGASTWFLYVTFYVCLQNLCKKSLTCHKNQVKVTQNQAQVMQGSCECFHVPIISIFAVLKRFCVNCAKFLRNHMKNHRNTIMYWRQQQGKTEDKNSFWYLFQGSQRA